MQRWRILAMRRGHRVVHHSWRGQRFAIIGSALLHLASTWHSLLLAPVDRVMEGDKGEETRGRRDRRRGPETCGGGKIEQAERAGELESWESNPNTSGRHPLCFQFVLLVLISSPRTRDREWWAQKCSSAIVKLIRQPTYWRNSHSIVLYPTDWGGGIDQFCR